MLIWQCWKFKAFSIPFIIMWKCLQFIRKLFVIKCYNSQNCWRKKILILQTTTIQNRTFDILLLILSLVNKRGKTFTPNKMKVQKSTFQSVHISKTFYTKKNLFPRISFSKLKLLHKRKYFDNAIILVITQQSYVWNAR